MRLRRMVTMAVALAVALAACGGGAAEETDPISIGIIADLTGPFTTYGTSLDRSARLAIKEVNEDGGIDGRQVEVITEDIQTDVGCHRRQGAPTRGERRGGPGDGADRVRRQRRRRPGGRRGQRGAALLHRDLRGREVSPHLLLVWRRARTADPPLHPGAPGGVRPAGPALRGRLRVAPPQLRDRQADHRRERWRGRGRDLPAPGRRRLHRVGQRGARHAARLHVLARTRRRSPPPCRPSTTPGCSRASARATSSSETPTCPASSTSPKGCTPRSPTSPAIDTPEATEFLEAFQAEFGEDAIPSGGEGVGAYDGGAPLQAGR